jgi:hypothetical protein
MYAQLHGLLCSSYTAVHSCDPSGSQIGGCLLWPSLNCREGRGIAFWPYFSIAAVSDVHCEVMNFHVEGLCDFSLSYYTPFSNMLLQSTL